MKATKVRKTIAGVFAVLLIIVFLAVGARVMGWNIPVLNTLADAMRIPAQQ